MALSRGKTSPGVARGVRRQDWGRVWQFERRDQGESVADSKEVLGPRGSVSAAPPRRKRQWGTDKRFGGSPVIPDPPGRGAISAARFALFFTVAAWFAYVVEQVLRLERQGVSKQNLAESGVYLVIVTLLTMSACAYLLARLGYFERIKNHRRVARSAIDEEFEHGAPSIQVIIPSYREDARVIRQTLLSTALQEYPDLRITLLVDDPPYSPNPAHRKLLERARELPGEVMELMSAPRRRFELALGAFEAEYALAAFEKDGTESTLMATPAKLNDLAEEFAWAAAWFADERRNMQCVDHADEFLSLEILGRLQNDFQATSNAIRAAAQEQGAGISVRRVRQMYLRLVRTFSAEINSFERKQYASLSHEPNKAMNLNSYLGLMGGSFTVANSPDGRVLVPAGDRTPDLVVPQADYVVTLDADSMLLPEYCLRLVHHMEQPMHSRVAVAQTPYSSYRGAPTRIERIAGATTDIQHIVHQGLTRYDATFWVGANAVIRKRALDELEETEDEGGFIVKRYIKDRTVIEDTESSIDLRSRGWTLYNYPERLSYSATPPDFGSLVIQRQRWANGGLVILPSLLSMAWKPKNGMKRITWEELFLRVNYLASISWASAGLLLLLFYPFDGELLSRVGVFTALPYFWAMSSDLRREGYRRSDIFRIYGFNLLLLPVNMFGTVQSMVQGIGGQKIAFARTPKVRDRTVAPLLFVTMPVLLIAWSAKTFVTDIESERYIHSAFAATNFFMTGYACLAFVGPWATIVDIFMNVRSFIFQPVDAGKRAPANPHWASVIYFGNSVPEEVMKGAALAASLAAKDASGDRRSTRAEVE